MRIRYGWLPLTVMLAALLWQLWPVVWHGALPLPAGHLVREAQFSVSPAAARALAGKHLAGATDAGTFFLPHLLHLWRSLHAGEFPLWEPYSTCGHPFLAEAESGVFYPPYWLGLLLPPLPAFGLMVVLDFLLREVGMYLLLRRFAVAPLLAATGAVAYALSGFYTNWLGTLGVTATAGWLPWIWLLYEQGVSRRQRAWLVAGCLICAAQFMPGHMQTAAYNCMALVLYAVVRAVLAPSRWRRALMAAATMLVVGGLLAAPQLLPLLEQLPGSVRLQQQELQLMSFDQLALFIAPDVFRERGIHAVAEYVDLHDGRHSTGTVHATETGSFIGTVTLFAAFGTLAALPRRGWPLLALIMVALLVSMNETAQRLLVGMLPPLAAMYHRRVLLLAQCALLLLGMLGLQRGLRRSPWLCLLCYAAPAVIILLAAQAGMRAWLTAFVCPLLLAAAAYLRLHRAAWRVLAIVLLLGEMLWFAHGRNSFAPSSVVARLIADTALAAQTAAGDGRVRDRQGELLPDGFDLLLPVRGIGGHQNIARAGYVRLCTAFEPVDSAVQRLHSCEAFTIPWLPPVSERLCRLLSVRTVWSRVPLPWPRRNAESEPVGAYAVPDPLPRAAVLPATVVADDTRALQLLRDDSFPLARCVVLAPGSMPPPLCGSATGTARVVRETGSTCTVRAHSSGPALLLLTDAWDGNWSATVNGIAVPIWRANVAFRAVPLPGGEATVEFTYRSPALVAGCSIAAVAALLLLWWLRVGRHG